MIKEINITIIVKYILKLSIFKLKKNLRIRSRKLNLMCNHFLKNEVLKK